MARRVPVTAWKEPRHTDCAWELRGVGGHRRGLGPWRARLLSAADRHRGPGLDEDTVAGAETQVEHGQALATARGCKEIVVCTT